MSEFHPANMPRLFVPGTNRDIKPVAAHAVVELLTFLDANIPGLLTRVRSLGSKKLVMSQDIVIFNDF